MTVYLSVKMKNALKKAFGGELEFSLRNININGDKRGCSGFITNPANGVTVYIDTEAIKPFGLMYRYAKDNKDFTGCSNQWRKTFDEYITGIVQALRNDTLFKRELISFRKVAA